MLSKQTITALAAIGSLGIIPLTPGLAQAAAYTLDFDHDAKGNVIDFNNFDLLVGDWSADKPDDYDKK
ncbi:MAG: hypothetical protein F6K00_22490 [Leptolyngbya sp. SIOISBB]|nr:hypothetical protein [Leptolyngbya sp. SIOISBB]